MQTKAAAQLLVIALAASHLLAKDEEHTMEHPTFYRTTQVDGLFIFYREAGPTEAPTILLLHGLPTSSRAWLIGITWSRPIIRALDTAIGRTQKNSPTPSITLRE